VTISEIGTVIGIVLTVATGTATAAKYYADNEYVTGDDLRATEIRSLQRDVRRLERTERGPLTEKEAWRLLDLRHEIEQLKDQKGE
jgi:hypothetical protein